MTTKLFFQAITKFLLGFVLVGLLIFLPAGSLKFFKGWLFMGILFAPITIAGIIMMLKNPALLEKIILHGMIIIMNLKRLNLHL